MESYLAVNSVPAQGPGDFLEQCRNTFEDFEAGRYVLDDTGATHSITAEAEQRSAYAPCDPELLRQRLQMAFYDQHDAEWVAQRVGGVVLIQRTK